MGSYDLLATVGNTPLVELRQMDLKPGVRIFAKLEGNNPTGSIKDRTAMYLIQKAEEQGALRPGSTLVEASTGNTALSLAMIAKQKGYGLKVVMPQRVAPGIAEILELMGVEVIWQDFIAGMKGAIDVALRLGQEEGHYATRQFQEEANTLAHYQTTGPEILAAVPTPDVFIAGIGTGGTIMGVGRRLKEAHPQVKVIGVMPQTGDEIQGLRSLTQGYVPPLLDLRLLDGRFLIDSVTSFATMKLLLEREGLFAGVSSGAVLHAALRIARRMERGTIIVLLADTGWRYMPALFGMEELKAFAGHPDDRAWW